MVCLIGAKFFGFYAVTRQVHFRLADALQMSREQFLAYNLLLTDSVNSSVASVSCISALRARLRELVRNLLRPCCHLGALHSESGKNTIERRYSSIGVVAAGASSLLFLTFSVTVFFWSTWLPLRGIVMCYGASVPGQLCAANTLYCPDFRRCEYPLLILGVANTHYSSDFVIFIPGEIHRDME